MDRRIVTIGAVAGAAAALVMGLFAMVAAATYQDTGFFTPLYHIASPLIGTEELMRSMGSTYFSPGPAILGLVVHVLVGIVWGVVFAFIASRLALRGWTAVLGGIVFGLVVMVVMAFVGLPITAAILRGGDMVRDMAMLVGWGTFTIEHAIYGLILGTVWAARGVRVAAAPTGQSVSA